MAEVKILDVEYTVVPPAAASDLPTLRPKDASLPFLIVKHYEQAIQELVRFSNNHLAGRSFLIEHAPPIISVQYRWEAISPIQVPGGVGSTVPHIDQIETVPGFCLTNCGLTLNRAATGTVPLPEFKDIFEATREELNVEMGPLDLRYKGQPLNTTQWALRYNSYMLDLHVVSKANQKNQIYPATIDSWIPPMLVTEIDDLLSVTRTTLAKCSERGLVRTCEWRTDGPKTLYLGRGDLHFATEESTRQDPRDRLYRSVGNTPDTIKCTVNYS